MNFTRAGPTVAHAKVEIGAMLPMQLVNSWFLNAQVGRLQLCERHGFRW